MIYCVLPSYVVDEENRRIQQEMIESFRAHTPENTFNILVDNGSIDPAYTDALQWADFSMRTDTPIGYAKAVNLGWQVVNQYSKSDDDVVVVLNNDLVFTHDGWIEALADHLNDKGIGAVAAEDQHPSSDQPFREHIWSSCFALKQGTRKLLGFFDDEQLPYRYHDQDYWCRLKKKGLLFHRVNAARVEHRESTTYKKMKLNAQEAQEEAIMRERWGVTMAQTLAR